MKTNLSFVGEPQGIDLTMLQRGAGCAVSGSEHGQNAEPVLSTDSMNTLRRQTQYATVVPTDKLAGLARAQAQTCAMPEAEMFT